MRLQIAWLVLMTLALLSQACALPSESEDTKLRQCLSYCNGSCLSNCPPEIECLARCHDRYSMVTH